MAIVERLIPSKPFPKRSDMFGLFDLVWLDPGSKQIGFVQTTSWAQRSAHKKKMLAGEGDTAMVLATMLAMGNGHVELYGWRKVGGFWEVSIERLWSIPALLGGDGLAFRPIEAPTMKAVRAEARRRAAGKSPDLD